MENIVYECVLTWASVFVSIVYMIIGAIVIAGIKIAWDKLNGKGEDNVL